MHKTARSASLSSNYKYWCNKKFMGALGARALIPPFSTLLPMGRHHRMQMPYSLPYYLTFEFYRSVFKVQTKADPSNLAYSTHETPHHVDLAYYNYQPGVSYREPINHYSYFSTIFFNNFCNKFFILLFFIFQQFFSWYMWTMYQILSCFTRVWAF